MITVNDLPREVRFLAKGTKEGFLKGIENGQIRNPIKLDVDVWLTDNGALCFMDREENRPGIKIYGSKYSGYYPIEKELAYDMDKKELWYYEGGWKLVSEEGFRKFDLKNRPKEELGNSDLKVPLVYDLEARVEEINSSS